jgi:hypothetical protein
VLCCERVNADKKEITKKIMDGIVHIVQGAPGEQKKQNLENGCEPGGWMKGRFRDGVKRPVMVWEVCTDDLYGDILCA